MAGGRICPGPESLVRDGRSPVLSPAQTVRGILPRAVENTVPSDDGVGVVDPSLPPPRTHDQVPVGFEPGAYPADRAVAGGGLAGDHVRRRPAASAIVARARVGHREEHPGARSPKDEPSHRAAHRTLGPLLPRRTSVVLLIPCRWSGPPTRGCPVTARRPCRRIRLSRVITTAANWPRSGSTRQGSDRADVQDSPSAAGSEPRLPYYIPPGQTVNGGCRTRLGRR
jgi:hypothetical protein